MQKKLLAVAVAGVFAAPALALAQASTVQIYGKVTAEYGYADQGDGRPKTDMLQNPGGSSVGVKGEEALGGGLAAWFQYETSADIRGQNNGDGFGSRNSALGLKGAFGNIHIGRWDTPFKRATVGMIGGGDTGLLGQAFVFAGNSTGTGAVGGTAPNALGRDIWKRREASQIYYESPSFSGLNVLAAYSSANATSATNASIAAKPRVQSIAAVYKNGPLEAGLGYERHNDFIGTGASAVGTQGDDRGWTLGASYNIMGMVKVGAQYIDTKYEMGPGRDLTKKNWMVGLDWHISGPHNLEASYVQAGDSKGNSTVGISGSGGSFGLAAPGSDTGAKWYSIAYRHDFSKRTLVKLGYVRLDNDDRASYGLGGLHTPTVGGANQNAWVMYAAHTF